MLSCELCTAADGGPAHRLDADDAGAETLILRDDLAPSSLRFALAREIGRRAAAGHIADLIDEAGLSEAAQPLAADFLAAYFAGAFLMPYDLFLDRAQAFRYDVERLAQTFGVSLEQACHRLATLCRPGQEGVRFHFLRIDRAGNVFKRFSGSGLPIPRFAGICPRWNVHAASGSATAHVAEVQS